MAGAKAMTWPLHRRMPPALLALGLHLPLWAALLSICLTFPSGCELALPWLFLAEGLFAWMLSRWLGLPLWWQLINLLFFPLAWLLGRYDIAPVWYLAAFLVLAITSLGSVVTRVPLFLSSRHVVEVLAHRLPRTPGLRLIDLGCGLGGPLAGLARLRPDLLLHGVEAAPLNWLLSRLRLLGRAQIRLGSLWDEDLSRYDIVYAYLSPAPMARLWAQARRQMRPGSLLISNSFEIPGVAPDEVLELDDLVRSRLLLWRIL
jgi:SAM-dependent methyltransferase